MYDFEHTWLWKSTLAHQPDPDVASHARDKLRNAFLRFRERVEVLAAEIPQDLPSFTVHDISHIDALWAAADLITGPDYPILTPTEAFVLGCAFLIHDLGMALAAHQAGLDALRADPHWVDAVARLFQQRLGRMPTADELERPDPNTQRQAIEQILRDQHPEYAQHVLFNPYKHRGEDEQYYLVDEPELRQVYGRIIGQIAASHGWPIERVEDEFGSRQLGAPSGRGYSAIQVNTWTVDCLKLACLLRVADACQLAGRAPGFLRALRKPSGTSLAHWVFQENLLQPQADPGSNRLRYTSSRPFPLSDAEAWWLCFDTLRMADGELRQVDALLAASGRIRFEAQGITGVLEPHHLSKLIPTEGWTPIDTQIKVTHVANLVRNLGGSQLYGQDSTVPLRELIQNASDAVRARRILDNKSGDWGDICVRRGQDEDGEHWIEVEDTGLGMSTAVLTGPLLDFGTSYWGSMLMQSEYPGLLSKGFEATGRYGIGFFSVFMWGERVRVTTRRHEDARRDTQILEFFGGPGVRPYLRPARENEFLHDGGTRVRVWLTFPPGSPKGLLPDYQQGSVHPWSLGTLCAWMCPSFEVNLYVEVTGEDRKLAVGASDWISMDGVALLNRILSGRDRGFEGDPHATSSRLRHMTDASGRVIGRVAIYGENRRKEPGIVTVGGLRAGRVLGLDGILIGTPTDAARRSAVPVARGEPLARWASEQADLLPPNEPRIGEEYAALIRQFGGQTGRLPITRGGERWMSAHDIEAWSAVPNEVLLVNSYEDYSYSADERRRLHYNDNVLLVRTAGMALLLDAVNAPAWPDRVFVRNDNRWDSISKTLAGAVIEALAKAWSLPLEDVLRFSDLLDTDTNYQRQVGTQDEFPLLTNVYVIRNRHGNVGTSARKG